MSDSDQEERARIAALLEDPSAELDPRLDGPIRLIALEAGKAGDVTAHVSATQMVPAGDDESLRDVYVPLPVTARVELDAKGRVRSVEVPGPPEESTREARAFARNLLATGAVRDAPTTGRGPRRGPGPPTRATHELVTDAKGRRVLRRIGFTFSPAGETSSGT